MPNHSDTTAFAVFESCVKAIQSNELIHRESATDKEFHFQNWVEDRLKIPGFNFERGGRNSYPDFRIVQNTEGYEVKGLAYPGRESTYDSNSQAPSGNHNGRTIFYVFGRYPKNPDGNTYPVLDFILCHGDFLNADHDYVHENKSVKGFGSYGDMMIRDRKMYVVPTPYTIAEGLAHTQTLILPSHIAPPEGYKEVGMLIRKEVGKLIASYSFDLKTNTLTPILFDNPNAGKEHAFKAWRLNNGTNDAVRLRENLAEIVAEVADAEEEDV